MQTLQVEPIETAPVGISPAYPLREIRFKPWFLMLFPMFLVHSVLVMFVSGLVWGDGYRPVSDLSNVTAQVRRLWGWTGFVLIACVWAVGLFLFRAHWHGWMLGITMLLAPFACYHLLFIKPLLALIRKKSVKRYVCTAGNGDVSCGRSEGNLWTLETYDIGMDDHALVISREGSGCERVLLAYAGEVLRPTLLVGFTEQWVELKLTCSTPFRKMLLKTSSQLPQKPASEYLRLRLEFEPGSGKPLWTVTDWSQRQWPISLE